MSITSEKSNDPGLTLNPMTFGLDAVDWQTRIDFNRMRTARHAKVQKMLKAAELPAALLVNNDNVRYATATKGIPYPQSRYALVFAEHGPVIFEMGEIDSQNRLNAPWIGDDNWRHANMWEGGAGGPDVIVEEAKGFATGILRVLIEKGLDKELLGVDSCDVHGIEALRVAGVRLESDERKDKDGKGLNSVMAGMLLARRNKTIDEVNCIRMATNITLASCAKVVEVAKVGVTERDVSAAATAAAIVVGGEIPNVVAGVTSGPRSFELGHMPTTDRILEFGDAMYVQCCGTAYSGYKTCVYRNFVVGRQPSQKQKDWYQRMYDRVHGAISEMKPGATTADMAKHFGDAIDFGIEDVSGMRAGEVAHGIGLSTHEYPWITKPWSMAYPLTLEEGMVIAVECHEGERFVGGFRLEEMIVVTKDGHEIITTWPSKELIACNPLL